MPQLFIPSGKPNNKDLLIAVTSLLSTWISQLRDLELVGSFTERDLEVCSLDLLKIAHPHLGLFDANQLQQNHPAVDILSGNRELGIQVKLTLNATVISDARKKWKEHTEPGEILHGSKEFWIIGAQLAVTKPRWKQTPGVDEWARLTEKLALKQCSDQQLGAMKDRLLTETRMVEQALPDERESIELLLGELDRPAIAALSNQEISVDDCVQTLEQIARLIHTGHRTHGLAAPEACIMPLAKMSHGTQVELRPILRKMHEVRVEIGRHNPLPLHPHRTVDAAKLALQAEINRFAQSHGHTEPFANLPLP